MANVSAFDTLLWVVFPYVALALFVLGHWWRYRYDQFGWTARSSQMYEDRILRVASPLFHFGILAVLVGHFMGLVIPKSFTNWLGISEGMYHFFAVYVGSVAGVAALVGLILLLWRRISQKSLRLVTTRMDWLMYAMLAVVMSLGFFSTVFHSGLNHFDYRENLSVWFRQVFYLQPDPALMAEVPFTFQMHAFLGFALLAIWPLTRLVHVFSMPLMYVFRPYIVYRSKDAASTVGRKAGWNTVKAHNEQWAQSAPHQDQLK
ncbi:MAG: respiratory nitrate reductase subunit gamma [Dermabacter sp.]|nr:respiratory nitrate reductase subunit gamma [Dermabacter sp.]